MRIPAFALVTMLISCGKSSSPGNDVIQKASIICKSSCTSNGDSSQNGGIDKYHPEPILTREREQNTVMLRRAAPSPLLLGPTALQQIYTKAFGDKPRAQAQFFNMEESDKLGGYRIFNSHVPSGTRTQHMPNMNKLDKLSSDYLVTLRRFSAQACDSLISREIGTPQNKDNKIVEGDIPSENKINSFLSILLGYQPTGKHHFAVTKYRDAFINMRNGGVKSSVETITPERTKSAYNHLCVALATDIRVYTR